MNDDADFWRNIGFNVIPSDGKIPLKGITYTQFVDKAIPIELHNYWKKSNMFDNGISIINGRLWNHEHRQNIFGHVVDTDTEVGTNLITNVNGVQLTLEDITKKGIAVDGHKGTPFKHHFIIFSEKEFPNLPANKSGIEVKGVGQLSTVPHTMNQDGTRRELIGDSLKALENCVTHSEFMYHIDEKLKSFGIEYLNGKAIGNYKAVSINEQKIPRGQRHAKLLSYANSLIARLHKTTNRETILRYFETYNNEECEIPLPSQELKQIFDDAWNNIGKSTTSKQENIGQILSVLQAKRLHNGQITVIGTITSVSDMYVLEFENGSNIEYKNAKSIQLEDTETLDDNERLDVVLYDNMINNIVAGETVKITGNMRIEDKKNNGKSKKKFNVLHASAIEYLNRKEILVTDRDIETFEKFVSLPRLLDNLT